MLPSTKKALEFVTFLIVWTVLGNYLTSADLPVQLKLILFGGVLYLYGKLEKTMWGIL